MRTSSQSNTVDQTSRSYRQNGCVTRFIIGHPIAAAFLTAIAVLTLIALALTAAVWLYTGSASRTDTAEALTGQPRTVLVLGLDGEGDQFAAKRSDAVLLVRIRDNPHRIDIVSIPRDSQVEMPECAGTHAGDTDKLNSAYAYGSVSNPNNPAAAGMTCAAEAISKAAGITIDDAVAATFAGLTGTIDALGGVDLPVDEDGLITRNAKAGQIKHFTGAEVLQQLRVRKAVADASDLSRIGRQQQVLGAVLDYYRDSGIVDNRGGVQAISAFAKINEIILTETEHTLSVLELQRLLQALVSTPVDFATLPTRAAPDGVNVLWDIQAEQFWQHYHDGADLPK